MDRLALKKGFAMPMEPYNNKVRIIIMKDGEEHVCRMEDGRRLSQFASSTEARIFKGRFQLTKRAGHINVMVKAAGLRAP
jgi:hypothetical protein